MTDDQGWTALHYSAKEGSYESVKLLLAMGSNIKNKTKNGKNCLHIAADYGHFNLCTTLFIKHNIDVQLADNDGWTAFHYFAKKGSYELVKAVGDMGIDINLKTNNGESCLQIAADNSHLNLCMTLINEHNFDARLPDDDGWTAFHYFASNGSYDLIKVVADMGNDIKLETNEGRNCLHIAAHYGHFNLCRTLISKHNFDVLLPDNDGCNALHYFAENGSYELVKVVADMGTDIKMQTNKGKNCLHIAADNSHLNLCMTLINEHNFDARLPDDDGWTAFHYFARNGSYDLVKVVADMGNDIKLETNEGKNCLHIAAHYGHFNLCRTLISKHNFDVLLPDNDGCNALHYFAENGSYELVKVVVDMGTDIKMQTNKGKNCLHIAADNSHLNLCMTLINEHNFDARLPDDDGWTAFHYFARNGSYDLVKVVADMGNDIKLETNEGKNCLHIAADCGHFNLCRKLISKHNFDVLLPDNDGRSAVHYFAKNGSYDLVKVVADMGNYINLKTNNGKNCLDIAADRGHFNLCRTLISKHNADVKLPDNDGWSAVHYFARKGSYDLVKVVADMGNDIKLETNEGKNCLHIAADYGHFNLCRTLISKHNFDVLLPDNDGCNALHYFAENGSYELVKVVADMGTDIKMQTNKGKNCLHIAADNSHLNLCMTLINEHNFDARLPDDDGWTAFHYFARNGSYDLVKVVADMGKDIKLETNEGKNCLHIAADYGYFNLCRTLISKHNFDVLLPENDGWSAVHYFAKNGSYDLVKVVADMGNYINLKTNNGKNCLDIAADRGHFNLCRTLISKHNADVKLPDNDGWSAVHYFARKGSYDLVKVVADMGNDIKLETNKGKNCLHIAAHYGHFNLCRTLISKHNFDVLLPDNDGCNALHYFAENGSYELVKVVADMGTDIKMQTNKGKNCLHIAADNSHLNLCMTLINEHNFDARLPDDDGWTAFHYFARNGSYDLVKVVADMGNDIKLETNEGKNCLHIAADCGHFNLCRKLISKHNFDVLLPENDGWSAVHYFAKNGSYDLVKVVADMGNYINLKTNNGKNCLDIAADRGHFNLCRTLISKHNADVKLPDNDGWSAVHYFARKGSYDLVKVVADMGNDIKLETNKGKNCLHIAAHYGHFNLCRTLISKHNFDVLLPDNDGCNALHYFAENGSYELVKVVADMGTDIKMQTNKGKNCLHIAADNSHLNLCMTLINEHNFDARLPDDDGWTAFHYFARNGSYDLVKVVADMGYDIKLETNEGKNCLHIAAHYGYFNLCRTLISKHNFDVLLPDNDGCNALHYFAENGSYELVKVVADVGTDIKMQTNKGKNCLHIAADNSHLNLCMTLINEHNFDERLPDDDGWTAFHYFAKSGSYDLVKVVADMGNDINLKTNNGKNCLDIAADRGHFNLCRTLISKHNADVKLPDNDGWSAVHYFARKGSYDLVKVVADMGNDIKLETNKGKNCLHIAAHYGHFNLCRTLISKHNFDVLLPDNDGCNALHYFAENGSYELVKVVADMGTDIKMQTNKGKNCLHIAADNSHLNLCMTLINEHNFDARLPDDDGWTAFHYFARNGSYDLVKVVADMGYDIKLETNEGKNCLHIAAHYGYFNLCRTLISKHNFDVLLPDNDGCNALHYFAENGSYELVKVVADVGTDIKMQTNKGKNCLHIAADNSHLNLCMTLINEHNFDERLPDDDGWTAFHYFAKSGSYDLVKVVADMGNDINLKTNNGKNCLDIAADRGHFNLCRTLISKHNADVKLPDNDGWSAVHYFARMGIYDLVKVVADMGNDIRLETNEGKNCLHIAADYDHFNLCRTLISKHNFDVLLPDNDGWSALHYFAKNGSYDLVKVVADMGNGVKLETNEGKNCLHIAADYGRFNLCRTLISKHNFDVLLTDNGGWSAVHYFARSGSYDLVKVVADMGNDIRLETNGGKNCLHIAADYRHFNLCRSLISKHNFDVLLPDNDGCNALHYFAETGSYDLVKVVADMGNGVKLETNEGKNCLHIAAHYGGHFNLCRTLISKHNFDVLLTDNDGWSAVHYFARKGSYDLVKVVADMGKDIKLETNEGKNCLHIAADYGHFNLCRTLISKHNFDVLLPDNDGCNALHYFAEKGSYDLVKVVADMGNDIKLETNRGKNCLHIAAECGHFNLCRTLISKHNFDVLLPDNDGCNAIHYFAENGSYELVKVVADMGTDIKMQTNKGKNCLHIAAGNRHLNLCMTLINEHNFDARLPDDDGWTAFHYFASNGSYDLIKVVADMGNDIKLETNEGKNCLNIAADYGHFNLCRTLISKHNFDVLLPDNDGCNALHYFAENGSYDLVKVVADMGNGFKLETNKGKNCLHIAADRGHFNLCRTLISTHNFDVLLPDNEGWNALHYFARSGSYDLVKVVADMGNDIKLETNEGKNCLHIAADYGHFNLCRKLISKHNFDVLLPDNDGWRAVHYFARNGSYDLVKAVADMRNDINLKTNNGKICLDIAADMGHFNLCRTLISKHNADVKLPDNGGLRAIHYFARNGSYDLVKVVADMGNDIKLETNEGKNCLHIAADWSHFNLCRTLISKHNFDVLLPDNDGWTALHYFARKGSCELVKAVADMGVEMNLKTNEGENCLHIVTRFGYLNLCKLFIEKYEFDVLMTTNDERTPLHCSVINGNFALFSYLLDKGSEIFCKTSRMENVLHLASFLGHFNICKFVLKYFIKEYVDNNIKNQYILNGKSYSSQVFYKYKAIFLHAMDVDGNTYLNLAAKGNAAKVCELLLRYDTEIITLSNKEDKTARDIAKDKGHENVLNVLTAEYERSGTFFKIKF